MYKLFLCLRYLRSKAIAYFAMIGVALCVAMMVIVISVMTGFLDKIEAAAKGLFGDVVVDTRGLSGLAYYDEFIDQVRQEVPEVEAGSPFILSVGILQFGSEHRQMVQIAGIRLPERAKVTDFEKGLFVQAGQAAPGFDPPVEQILQAVHEDAKQLDGLLELQVSDAQGTDRKGQGRADVSRLVSAIQMHNDAIAVLLRARDHQSELRELQSQIVAARQRLYSAGGGSFEQKERSLLELEDRLGRLERRVGFAGPEKRMILGLGLRALSYRTEQGQTVRVVLPGHKLVLTVVPLGLRGLDAMSITPVSRSFSVVDDVRTDVSSIDAKFVYVPFGTLQRLNNMDAEYSAEDPPDVLTPPRCSQVHFKVQGDHANGRRLDEVAARIRAVWFDFNARHPQPGGQDVTVQTWRERQAHIISNVDRQRTLVVIMFGIISLVSVVLIFVIFYMIVYQKTKDIGVLKTIGASSGGVAQIFLAWGAAVGLVGSALGTLGGYLFVRNINPIQDWLAETFGFRVWSKEYFLFEKIPNQVDWTATVFILVGAILAGLVGALIPAIRAGRMQPVEALRYE